MSDLSGRLSGGQTISGSLSGGSTLRGGLSMGVVSPAVLLDKADVITDTASGAIVSIPDGMASPVLGLSVDIEPIQDLHGYDNPWPAGGGKNKFDKTSATANSYISSSGNVSGSAGWGVSDYIPANEDTVYTLSGSGATGTAAHTGFYNASKGVISTVVNTQTTFTTPTGTAYIRISFLTNNIDTTQLELGSTATSYAPYSNLCPISGRSEVNLYVEETYDPQATPKATIQLGQTVYGGTVDVTRGKLTVDRGIHTESGQANWFAGSSANKWRWSSDVLNPLATQPSSQSDLSKALSDKFVADYNVWSDSGTKMAFLPRSSRLWVRFGADSGLTTADAVKSWFTSNPTQFVYELATPVEVTLTPQELDILFGDNNIWADSGDTTVEYRADTKLWILKKIAEALNS